MGKPKYLKRKIKFLRGKSEYFEEKNKGKTETIYIERKIGRKRRRWDRKFVREMRDGF